MKRNIGLIFSTDNQVTFSSKKVHSSSSHTCMTTDTCKLKEKNEVNNCNTETATDTQKTHLEWKENT